MNERQQANSDSGQVFMRHMPWFRCCLCDGPIPLSDRFCVEHPHGAHFVTDVAGLKRILAFSGLPRLRVYHEDCPRDDEPLVIIAPNLEG